MKPPLRIDENELGDLIDSEDSIIIEGESLSGPEAYYIVAAVNACHRLGLTVEQLEQDAIGRLVKCVEMALDLQENDLIDFQAYGLTVDNDIAVKFRTALVPFRKGSNA